MSLSTMSKCSLNTPRVGDSTASLGPLQCLTTVLEKQYFLTTSLNLPWHSLRPLSMWWLKQNKSGYIYVFLMLISPSGFFSSWQYVNTFEIVTHFNSNSWSMWSLCILTVQRYFEKLLVCVIGLHEEHLVLTFRETMYHRVEFYPSLWFGRRTSCPQYCASVFTESSPSQIFQVGNFVFMLFFIWQV